MEPRLIYHYDHVTAQKLFMAYKQPHKVLVIHLNDPRFPEGGVVKR